MKYNNKKNALILPLLLAGSLSAQANQHYVPGIEAIKAASAPGPGMYYKAYGVHYNADDADNLPNNSEVTVNAIAHRLIWVTEEKILDGELLLETILPMVSTDLNIGNMVKDDYTGLGDFFAGGALSWHGDNWDSVVGAGIWSPTGQDKGAAAAGKGYSELMLTLGGTLYLDNSKTYSLSVLSRYEIADDNDVEDSFLMEYGLGYKLDNGVEIGLAGYSDWEQGKGTAERHALGIEGGYFWPQYMAGINVAAYKEYSTTDTFEGHQLRLSLTKVF
ncbi:SphA family protein [Oceanospirillum sediminis]|uniref:Transporter n=1 Tax=Oceanospirillum sediminis TaxID=2760088 RepID=A0A839IRA1_9GAMM|nr:transporter [Oceanospirillum sediminis]MBB1486967.1 transporter [Oceanospirillum sediminis]